MSKLPFNWIHLPLLGAVVGLGIFVSFKLTASGDASEQPVNDVSFGQGAPTEGALATAAAGYADRPRQLSSAECSEARPRMEAQAASWAQRVETDSRLSAFRNQLSAAVADSRVWFDAGCPQHPVLGYYEAKDESGSLKSIILQFP